MCACVCTHVYVCVCFLLQTAYRMKWLIPQHWVRIKSDATTHLNEYENFKPPLHSHPQFLPSTLKNLRLSKHECMYAFMYMNSPSKVKGTEYCLLSHYHIWWKTYLPSSASLFLPYLAFRFVPFFLLPAPHICRLHRTVQFQPSKLLLVELLEMYLVLRVMVLL